MKSTRTISGEWRARAPQPPNGYKTKRALSLTLVAGALSAARARPALEMEIGNESSGAHSVPFAQAK